MSIGDGGLTRDTNTGTLSGTYKFPAQPTATTYLTMVANDAYNQNLDPGGAARTVVMPSGTGTQGGRCMIVNAADAAEAITVQQSDASTTVIVIDQNQSAELVCNGVSAAAGWQAVGITEA